MDLDGKNIVIIGGSSGMGLATAAAAATAGAAVTIASSDKSRLDTALAALPAGCAGAVIDTRSEASVAEALDRIGELDHLVYTAGDRVTPRPLTEVTPEEARQLFEVRFWGAVTAVRHAAPRIRPGGSIVLTSGTIGVRPSPGAALAAGSAAAIEGLTRGLAVELAPVRVNAIAAGFVDTPLSAELLGPGLDERREQLRATLPIGRVVEPADVAALAVHLMANTAVTGATYDIDGGEQLV